MEIEEMADNIDELEVEIEEESKVVDASDIDEVESNDTGVVDKTKEYSTRLNNDRIKIREEIEKEQRAKLDGIAKSRNFENWDELESAMEKERLEQMGIVNEDEFKKYLNDVIANTPEMVKAKEIIAREEQSKHDLYVKDEILKINKINSDIKTIDDLISIDRYDDFNDRIKNGYSLSDAYKLTYFDDIQNKKFEAGKNKALLNNDSKSHMKTVSGGAVDEVVVPDDVLASYKANTKMTDAEIKKHYAKYMEQK